MKRILFVCVHNAGRSVMAAAFCNALSAEAVQGISAGTEPQGHAHPEVVDVMREIGIDIAEHTGTMLTDEVIRDAERVITMGCAVDSGACPAIRYAVTDDWDLPDPKGKPMGEVRAIRDDIRARVEQLLAEVMG